MVYFFTFLEVLMNSISYYSQEDQVGQKNLNRCSIASDEYPITVNCAGNFKTVFPFTTDNPTGRQDIYLLYVVRGELDVLINGEMKKATSGDVAIFAPNTHYKYTYSAGEPLDYMWVHFTGSYAERLLKECALYPLPYLRSTHEALAIPHYFRKIYEAFENGSSFQRHEAATALESVILAVANAINGSKESKCLERSVRYIHSSYSHKISVPELAAMENLSNSRYIALFNAQLGMSPTAYIIKLRMSAACDLLSTTDLNVKQVGLSVGYEDPHFFSKLFKKHVGISPKDYKKEKIQNMIHNI